MDGTLFLEGYKLKYRISLNLQQHTILLSHSDMFTPTVLFDMIERYFNKQNFSDTYQKGVHLRLNEKKLSPTDFQVWRIHPTVNAEEEIKIAKKTLLGQYLEQLYRDKQEIFERIGHNIETELLRELNMMLARYDMRLDCDEQYLHIRQNVITQYISRRRRDIIGRIQSISGENIPPGYDRQYQDKKAQTTLSRTARVRTRSRRTASVAYFIDE